MNGVSCVFSTTQGDSTVSPNTTVREKQTKGRLKDALSKLVLRQQLNEQAHVVVVVCQVSEGQADSGQLETHV